MGFFNPSLAVRQSANTALPSRHKAFFYYVRNLFSFSVARRYEGTDLPASDDVSGILRVEKVGLVSRSPWILPNCSANSGGVLVHALCMSAFVGFLLFMKILIRLSLLLPFVNGSWTATLSAGRLETIGSFSQSNFPGAPFVFVLTRSSSRSFQSTFLHRQSLLGG
jgi:hypothetical protein